TKHNRLTREFRLDPWRRLREWRPRPERHNRRLWPKRRRGCLLPPPRKRPRRSSPPLLPLASRPWPTANRLTHDLRPSLSPALVAAAAGVGLAEGPGWFSTRVSLLVGATGARHHRDHPFAGRIDSAEIALARAVALHSGPGPAATRRGRNES